VELEKYLISQICVAEEGVDIMISEWGKMCLVWIFWKRGSLL